MKQDILSGNRHKAHLKIQRHKRGKTAYWQGWIAEWWACMILWSKGYRLLARRFRTPVGEIDLLMHTKGILVGVEVKKRDRLQSALESVTPKVQKRFVRAMEVGAQMFHCHAACGYRLDVFCVGPWYTFRHVKNAVWDVKRAF